MQEALPVFLALALMNMIVAPDATLAMTGALVFLVARVLYVRCLYRRRPGGAHAACGP